MELVVVIGIICIIGAIVFPKLNNFQQQQDMKNTSEDIISLLNEARNNTISSKDSNTYGVHFQSDRAILFSGSSFNSFSSDNKQINFESSVRIPTTGGINLGGGSDVIFKRITGETTQSGTIIIQLVQHKDQQRIITIYKTGIIDIN